MNESSTNPQEIVKPKANKAKSSQCQVNTGNPQVELTPSQEATVQQFRQLLLSGVEESDFIKVVKKLTSEAKKGNIKAIKEFLDRTCGRPSIEVEGNLHASITSEEKQQLIMNFFGIDEEVK